MQLFRIALLSLSLYCFGSTLHAANVLSLGQTLPTVNLEGSHGGLVKDGSAWQSDSMKGTLTFLVYVDPDDSTLNDALIDRMQEEKFPDQFFRSVAVINLAATWKPNSLIMQVLKTKQERFPRTTYVFDKDRFLAQSWGLTPEGYHTLLTDRDGRLVYEKVGKLDDKEINQFVSLIHQKVEEARQDLLAKPKTSAKELKTKKSL